MSSLRSTATFKTLTSMAWPLAAPIALTLQILWATSILCSTTHASTEANSSAGVRSVETILYFCVIVLIAVGALSPFPHGQRRLIMMFLVMRITIFAAIVAIPLADNLFSGLRSQDHTHEVFQIVAFGLACVCFIVASSSVAWRWGGTRGLNWSGAFCAGFAVAEFALSLMRGLDHDLLDRGFRNSYCILAGLALVYFALGFALRTPRASP